MNTENLRKKIENISKGEIKKYGLEILDLNEEIKKIIDEDIEKIRLEFGNESLELKDASSLQTSIHNDIEKMEEEMNEAIDECTQRILDENARIEKLIEQVKYYQKTVDEQDSDTNKQRLKQVEDQSDYLPIILNIIFEDLENILKNCKIYALDVIQLEKQFVEKRHEIGIPSVVEKTRISMAEANLKFSKLNVYETQKKETRLKAVERGLKLNKFRPKRYQKSAEDIFINFQYKKKNKYK